MKHLKIASKWLLCSLLLLSLPGTCQTVPDAPISKARPQESLKFWLLAAGHALSTESMIYAMHDGARQCVAEDNRAGVGNLFNTADGYGRKPHNAYVLIPAASVLGTAIIFHYTGHKKLANYILGIYSISQTSVAISTYWAGCN